MTMSLGFKLALGLLLAGIASLAIAGNRSIRVDGFGDWVEFARGSAGCPGTTSGSAASNTLVTALGQTFSGRANTAFLTDTYCQVPTPGAGGSLSSANYFHSDEADLAAMMGDGTGMTGIRYSMLDRPRFDFTTPPTGFQWTFFNFPTGITIVGLYGLQTITLDSTSSISGGIWNGNGAVYDGRYWCFRGNTYLGTWNGLSTDTGSPCLKAANVLFRNGFEP